MIRHVVMWKLKDPSVAPHFKALLDSCRGLTEGMLRYEVGIRSDGLEANLDVLLLSEFADTRALAAYQNHPHHKRVSAKLGPLRESRHVLDVEIAPPLLATK